MPERIDSCSGCSLIVYMTRGAAERCGLPTCACGSIIRFAESQTPDTSAPASDQLALDVATP